MSAHPCLYTSADIESDVRMYIQGGSVNISFVLVEKGFFEVFSSEVRSGSLVTGL